MKDGSCVLQPGILCAEFKRICNDYEYGLDVITGVSSSVVSWKNNAVQSCNHGTLMEGLLVACFVVGRREINDQKLETRKPLHFGLDSFDFDTCTDTAWAVLALSSSNRARCRPGNQTPKESRQSRPERYTPTAPDVASFRHKIKQTKHSK